VNGFYSASSLPSSHTDPEQVRVLLLTFLMQILLVLTCSARVLCKPRVLMEVAAKPEAL
jgi:hypothetical protein